MSRSSKNNHGIQINNGTLQAINVAIGKNASAYSGNESEILVPISDLKALLNEAVLSFSDRKVAEAAVAEIVAEVRKPAPEKQQIQNALNRLAQLGATSTALFPLIDRMTPLLQRIGQSLLG